MVQIAFSFRWQPPHADIQQQAHKSQHYPPQVPVKPASLDPHRIQTRHPHRSNSSHAAIDSQGNCIQRGQCVWARRDVVQAKLDARERHRNARAEKDSCEGSRPECRAEVGAEEFVEQWVQGHFYGPRDAADTENGAGARLTLQVREAE